MSETSDVSPQFLCAGGIFIDDIVFPDGTTHMETLGGGAVHAAAGMALWGERAGLVACVGTGLPTSAAAYLQRYDQRGIVTLNIPQARSWQIFEWDGKRTEVFRMQVMTPFVDDPQPQDIQDFYHDAQSLYMLRDAQNVLRWRACYPDAIILWEPNQPYMVADNQAEFRAALPKIDVVSPNWVEAHLLYGIDDPVQLVSTMLSDGVNIAILRMGERGSLVGIHNAGKQTLFTIPAIPVETIADVTGAGNSYCGAFLVGWCRAGDLQVAACYGTVAASFTIEMLGVMRPDGNINAERDRRFGWALEHTEVIA